MEVIAVVEDVELRLIHAFTEQVLAGTSTATNHLPELGLGMDGLEEHQVDDSRNINTGIQHVHTHRNVDAAGFAGFEGFNQLV